MNRGHFPGALLTPRRIFMRPWRLKMEIPYLAGGILCTLFLSWAGTTIIAPWCGLLNGAIISTFAGAFLLLALAYMTFPRGFISWKTGFRRVGWREIKLIAVVLIVLLAGSAALTGVWQQILDHLQIPYEEEQFLVQMAKNCSYKTFGQLLLLTAVAVPLTEELVFRRFLYELLQGLGAKTALFAGAFIFAAAHGFLLGMPGLFFMGILFQILCNSTRNLWCSVICHSLLNASVLIMTRAVFLLVKD
ncbi:MAG: CPBP family intramembrane metalloprotease [Lentisphaeria bacterium]|nr:CPBP family intramembrane metalloprotease [Lentisphaeria bacterium]